MSHHDLESMPEEVRERFIDHLLLDYLLAHHKPQGRHRAAPRRWVHRMGLRHARSVVKFARMVVVMGNLPTVSRRVSA